MKYKHTQNGNLMIIILIIAILLFGIILAQTDFNFFITVLMFFILFIIYSFKSLQVKIDEKYLKIKFGYGIFQKKFLLNNITSAKIVKNHWYYGWGIRLWLWPYMWIFNVSGLDAVEIKTKNNKIYRIGTDEPEKLKQVILQARK